MATRTKVRGESTQMRLARELRAAELPALALRAQRGEWDVATQGNPEVMRTLVRILRAHAVTSTKVRPLLRKVRKGEFYNTPAELRAAQKACQ